MKTHTALQLIVLLAIIAVQGCDLYGKVGVDDVSIPGELPKLLCGEWVFIQQGAITPAERYLIDEETLQYGYGEEESTFGFRGAIRFVSNFSDTSGVIIIEYFEDGRPSYPDHNGNFFAIYYQNLNNDTVQLANSTEINDNYSAPDTAALEEAIKKFTFLKMGNFVDWGSVQPQSRVRH